MKYISILFIVASRAWACGPGVCDFPPGLPDSCLGYSRGENRICLSDLPWVDPGNDSAYNARLVSGEKAARKDGGMYVPCVANTPEVEAIFDKAVDAAKPVAAEELKAARKAMLGGCGKPNLEGRAKIAALPAGDFKTYLEGAYALYYDDAKKAADIFRSIKNSSTAWVAETATYLMGRVLIVAAQKNWPGYRDFQHIDKELVKEARAQIDEYLKAYPTGLYANSASGLRRRTAYFLQDQPLFASLVFQALEMRAAPAAELDFGVDYTNEKIPWEYPVAATAGLMLTLRQPVDKIKLAPDSTTRLEAAKVKYDRYPGLFPQLKKALAIATGDLDSVAGEKAMTPADASLVAQALENAKRYREARPHWARLLNLTHDAATRVTLALGRNHLLVGDLPAFVAKDAAWAETLDEKAVGNVLRQGATVAKLKEIADSDAASPMARKQADRLLLARYVLLGDWAKFAARIETSPNRKEFEAVETAAKELAKNPQDPKALLNAGYYLDHFGHSPLNFGPITCDSALSNQVATEALAELKNAQPPIVHYRKALAALKGKERDEVEAKLLYYSLLCFRRGAHSESCLWRQEPDAVAPVSQRKAWFKQLKTRYAATKWGKELTVYY